MTRIFLTPLVQTEQGQQRTSARLTAVPTFATQNEGAKIIFSETKVWNIDRFQDPVIDLVPPAIGSGWVLTLTSGHVTIERTVAFYGPSVTWSDLIDLDPDTLNPTPTNEQLAAWQVVRDQLAADVERIREVASLVHEDNTTRISDAIRTHRNDETPHPFYDDMQDLVILFENEIVVGTVTDPENAYIPDLTTIFDENL